MNAGQGRLRRESVPTGAASRLSKKPSFRLLTLLAKYSRVSAALSHICASQSRAQEPGDGALSAFLTRETLVRSGIPKRREMNTCASFHRNSREMNTYAMAGMGSRAESTLTQKREGGGWRLYAQK
jgi:hypothetical protein